MSDGPMRETSTPGRAAAARTVVVVPCFNEALRLKPDPFLEFLEEAPWLEILFVDDGSTDGTARVLQGLQAGAGERVGVLRLPENRGKAEAVRLGILRALEAEDRPVRTVGYWDADLSTPLGYLPLFVDHLGRHPRCRMVIGSRVRLLGREIHRRPFRHYVGRVFSTLASLALDLPVYDTQCGAKLLRAGPGVREAFSTPFSDPWLFDVELLLRLREIWGEDMRSLVYELPLPSWHDVEGSKVSLLDGVRAAFRLGRIWRRRVAGRRE